MTKQSLLPPLNQVGHVVKKIGKVNIQYNARTNRDGYENKMEPK